MRQNGILLTFSRLATVCLCFCFYFLFFGRASEFPVPFNFPSSSKLHPLVLFPKASQTKAWGQEKQPESVCLLTLLQYQTWAYYLWVSIYILLSTSCTLRFEASAFFCSSTALSGGFLFSSACLSVCIFLCVCGESSGICWIRKSSQREGLFSALNENLATGICHSQFNLSSKLEG